MATATVEQVAVTLGRLPESLTNAEQSQIGQWLEDAELQIRLKLGEVAALDLHVVEFVEREAVARKVRQPVAGATSEEVAVDDARTVRRYERSSGLVEILPEWWEMLGVKARSRKAFSISPSYTSGYRL